MKNVISILTQLFVIIFLFLCEESYSQSIKPDIQNVEYARVDSFRLMLDIYFPKNVSKPYPVIVWIHGGAWTSGSKENPNGLYMLQQGYAIVSINYRLSQQAIFPAQIHDCKSTIRWIRANASLYGFDPDKIGVWGSSAGGHLVALLGTAGNVSSLEGSVGGNVQYQSNVQAVCDWYGPSNFETIGNYPSSIDRSLPTCPEAKLIGGNLKDNLEKARAASPITYVTSDDPPFLIMHGTKDMTVPFHQSVELDSALRLAKVNCTFIPIVDAGHGGGGFGADSTRNRVINFFNRFLKSFVSFVHKSSDNINDLSLHLYPNPSKTSLTAHFALTTREYITARIIDVFGKIVNTIYRGYLESGDHEMKLNLQGFSAGVYFCRIISPNLTKTKIFRVLR